jgi:nitrite reductase/ring-hydroxylating ferredoxin subunit
MSHWVEIATVGEIRDGAMKEIRIDDLQLVLARARGKYYLASNRCTHLGGKLAEGELNGTVVTCPLHGSQFDLKDGHVVRWINEPPGIPKFTGKLRGTPTPLKMYEVTTKDDKIIAKIS